MTVAELLKFRRPKAPDHFLRLVPDDPHRLFWRGGQGHPILEGIGVPNYLAVTPAGFKAPDDCSSFRIWQESSRADRDVCGRVSVRRVEDITEALWGTRV